MNRLFSQKMSRRKFITGVSTALLGLVIGCRQEQKLSPSPQAPPLQATPAAPLVPHITLLPPAGDAVPDMILHNAKVLTVDARDSIAQAIAIKDSVIQKVGSDQEVLATAGENTQRVDVGGRVITPGLIDAHIHLRAVGLNNVYFMPLIPPEVVDVQSLQKALAELVKKSAPGEWIQGYYMALRDKPIPDRYDLDAVSADNPVFIMQISGHYGVANSAALQLAGVNASTQSPAGGIIEKDKNGEPTGVFFNHVAMDILRKATPPITEEMTRDGILTVQPLMAATGMTSFHDNNIRDLKTIRIYQELAKNGQMYLRSTLYYTLEYQQNLQNLAKIDYYEDALTRFAGYKILIDGSGLTAFCHEKHNGVAWTKTTWEADIYQQTIRALHDSGGQISVHCVGDAAVDLTIDAYEAAMNANPRPDPRHRIEHAVLTTPQATQRIKDLGILIHTNPQFLYIFGSGFIQIFGEHRAERIIPTREWLESGVHLSIGSDAPSCPWYAPCATLAGAMNRMAYTKQVIGSDQALTFMEALRAHTYEAAYAAHEEHLKGSIEPGKYADLAVWQQDPEGMTPGELFNMPPMYMTLVGGKVVHQA
ncbi:MAG: amidohydrolase family protein [Anaerolineae bacterium]|nr:amidohydrolase family protein [Anaerolineae bacterium]